MGGVKVAVSVDDEAHKDLPHNGEYNGLHATEARVK